MATVGMVSGCKWISGRQKGRSVNFIYKYKFLNYKRIEMNTTRMDRLQNTLKIVYKLKNFRGKHNEHINLYDENRCHFVIELRSIFKKYVNPIPRQKGGVNSAIKLTSTSLRKFELHLSIPHLLIYIVTFS